MERALAERPSEGVAAPHRVSTSIVLRGALTDKTPHKPFEKSRSILS